VEGFLYRSQLQPVAWLNNDGSVKATFVYGGSANVPEYMVQGSTTYRLVTDQVGSVRLVVNTSTGAVVERIDYDEFGNVLSDTGSVRMTPFGFAGGLWDRDSGLVRFGARDYNSETARWIAKDARRFAAREVNLYARTHSDPMNFVDASGLEETSTDAAGIAACRALRASGVSQSDNAEYIGLICMSLKGNRPTYWYTSAAKRDSGSARLPPAPLACTPVGWYHSHGLYRGKLDDELFSPADMDISDSRGPGFLLTPVGRIRKYAPGGGAYICDETKMSCAKGDGLR
jgi:RHS repeat-associated protein